MLTKAASAISFVKNDPPKVHIRDKEAYPREDPLVLHLLSSAFKWSTFDPRRQINLRQVVHDKTGGENLGALQGVDLRGRPNRDREEISLRFHQGALADNPLLAGSVNGVQPGSYKNRR